MEIFYLKSCASTHTYLKEYIKANGYLNPLAVVTKIQTNGIGSRDNNWESKDGNLFFSFVLNKKLLPNDLELQSASIYFSYLLKDILSSEGSLAFLKWPNDFYCHDKKLGGTITTIKNNLIYCGIGLNLKKVNNNFGYLDISIDIPDLLKKFFNELEKYPSWKQIFSKFEIEFKKTNDFKTNIKNQQILLKDTILQKDGSLLVNGKKVFSLR